MHVFSLYEIIIFVWLKLLMHIYDVEFNEQIITCDIAWFQIKLDQ